MGGNIGNNIDSKYLDNMDTYNRLAYEYLTDSNDNWEKGTGLNSNLGKDFLGRNGTNITNHFQREDDNYNLSWLGGNSDKEALVNAFIIKWATENPTKSIDEDVLNRFDNLASRLIIAKDRGLIEDPSYKNLIQNLGNYPEGSTGISKDKPIEDILNMSTNISMSPQLGLKGLGKSSVNLFKSNIYFNNLDEAKNKGILAQQNLLNAKKAEEEAYEKDKPRREAIEEFIAGYYLSGLEGRSQRYLERNKDEMESLGLNLEKVEDLAKQYR